MFRTIDIRKEIEGIQKGKEFAREQILSMEGAESYYANLIKQNILTIQIPISEKEKESLQKILDDDDI